MTQSLPLPARTLAVGNHLPTLLSALRQPTLRVTDLLVEGSRCTSELVSAAVARELALHTVRRRSELENVVRGITVDVAVMCSFGWIWRRDELTALGAPLVNLHHSLLPRHRGRHPVARAIAAGSTETGITAHLVGEAIDVGEVLGRAVVPIDPLDTDVVVADRLDLATPSVLAQAIATIADCERTPELLTDEWPVEPPFDAATEGCLDLRGSPRQLYDLVRSQTRNASTWLIIDGEKLHFDGARLMTGESADEPGRVVERTPQYVTLAIREGLRVRLSIAPAPI